ncbi:MAG: iron export ABC transporter permease subunit FetB [Desulfuromonadales bacterium]
MNAEVIDLDLLDLAIGYSLILLTAALARLQGIGQEREMIWASLRMVFQLLAIGYVLHLVFAFSSAWPVMLVLLAMGAFSVQVLGGRIKRKIPDFYAVVGSAIFIGCGGVTFFFCLLIVGLEPWYDPRYMIPLSGMIIGNSMNGAALAAERLSAEMNERRDEIEAALCLGATARMASREAVRSAFRAALIPTTNTMAAMGLVFLPGMMTGQILSGTAPVLAVKYQIAIMFAITGSVAVTAFLILIQGYRRYFTPAHQLRDLR